MNEKLSTPDCKQIRKMNDTEKTEIILKALEGHYSSWGRGRCNVVLPELRLGSGYSDVAQRRIDLFLISSEKGNYTTAFEIKVSRQDFQKDIKNELKQRGARLYSSNFYYVAPKGMLKIEEIPMWAGLIEFDFSENTLRTVVPAPLQSRNTPSWSLTCAIVRKVNAQLCVDKIKENKNLAVYWESEYRKKLGELKYLAKEDSEHKELILNKYKEVENAT